MTVEKHNQADGFGDLGLAPAIIKILDQLQFKIPTPIQHQSIPPAVAGKDIMGIAQTGTGKTLAYGLPLIDRLLKMPGRALIISPTRELALQVEKMLQVVGRPLGLRTAVLIGGESFRFQLMALRDKPRIVVATPGRLIDHLEQNSIKLGDVKILVLDEADRMLDMGFTPQINQILKTVPAERQTLLYSATMPAAIVKLATSYMKLPVRVEVAPAGTAAEKVEQEIIIVKNEAKLELLESLLSEYSGTVLVFSRTRQGAKRICQSLGRAGHKTAEIHADRSQGQRKEALEGFRRGKYRVLVATDIAARGIDVSHIEVVINFDLPDNSEDYIHRIGRTGRAGRAGKAVSFATPSQKYQIRDIEKLIRKTLKIKAKFVPKDISKPAAFVEVNEHDVFVGDERPKQRSRGGRPSGGGNFRGGRSSSHRGGGRRGGEGRGSDNRRSNGPSDSRDHDNRGNRAPAHSPRRPDNGAAHSPRANSASPHTRGKPESAVSYTPHEAPKSQVNKGKRRYPKRDM